MLPQEPDLCSAEKARRLLGRLCVCLSRCVYCIAFNAAQNPNLARAFFYAAYLQSS